MSETPRGRLRITSIMPPMAGTKEMCEVLVDGEPVAWLPITCFDVKRDFNGPMPRVSISVLDADVTHSFAVPRETAEPRPVTPDPGDPQS